MFYILCIFLASISRYLIRKIKKIQLRLGVDRIGLLNGVMHYFNSQQTQVHFLCLSQQCWVIGSFQVSMLISFCTLHRDLHSTMYGNLTKWHRINIYSALIAAVLPPLKTRMGCYNMAVFVIVEPNINRKKKSIIHEKVSKIIRQKVNREYQKNMSGKRYKQLGKLNVINILIIEWITH